MEAIMNFIQQTGFYQIATGDWKVLIMMVISFVLLYLAIVKKFEPLLLLPIAFGMLITNLPGAGMYHEILFAGGHPHWAEFGGAPITQEFLNELSALGVSDAVLGTVQVGETISVGLIDVLYLGVKLGIYPCLIFMGVGASTDFGPLIANPKTLPTATWPWCRSSSPPSCGPSPPPRSAGSSCAPCGRSPGVRRSSSPSWSPCSWPCWCPPPGP